MISQSGEELNVLALLFTKIRQCPGDISAAFIRLCLPRSVYIEGRSPLVIQCCLQSLSSSISWRQGVHLVPLPEWVQLLQMRTRKLGVDVGDWVRIKRGTYSRDLGYVLHVDNLTLQARLLVVPRITYRSGTLKSQPGKRPKAQQPPRALLDINLASTITGSHELNGARFKGMTFMERLLIKEYKQHDLITANVHPTYEEINLFHGNTAVAVSAIQEWEAADAISALRIDDHVEVLVGELKGCCGVILDIQDNVATVEIQREGSAMPDKYLLDMPPRDIRKSFRDGDFVGIRHGVHAGVTGYILSVSADGLTATLYRYDTDTGLDMTSQVRI